MLSILFLWGGAEADSLIDVQIGIVGAMIILFGLVIGLVLLGEMRVFAGKQKRFREYQDQIIKGLTPSHKDN